MAKTPNPESTSLKTNKNMLFSRKCTIRVTYRSQNIENTWAFLSFKVDMTFTLNNLDLQMTLTFKLPIQVQYNTNIKLKYVNYEILVI